MGRFIDAVHAGLRAAAEGPDAHRYTIRGHAIICPTCEHGEFIRDTAIVERFALFDRWSTILVCAECSRIEWFVDTPERIDR